MTGEVGIILMEIFTVTLANSTSPPPYRKRRNGEVVPCLHFPLPTHSAGAIGEVAARLARLTLEHPRLVLDTRYPHMTAHCAFEGCAAHDRTFFVLEYTRYPHMTAHDRTLFALCGRV